MDKSFFTEVIFVKNENSGYTLIIPCAFKIEAEHIPLVADKLNKESFENALQYCIGWWIGICQNYSLVLNKVEVILPPFMEYLPISPSVYNTLKKAGVLLEIKSGTRLEIHEEEINESMPYIHEKLSKLSQRSFNNN